jgi:hypothetical protein
MGDVPRPTPHGYSRERFRAAGSGREEASIVRLRRIAYALGWVASLAMAISAGWKH